MNKPLRIFIIISLILLAGFVITSIIINNIIEDKVENFVKTRLPNNMKQSYKDLSLDMWAGTLTFSDASLTIKSKKTDSVHTQIKMDKFIIEDVSYWDYLINDEIHIEDIKLKKPTIIYYSNKQKPISDSTPPKSIKLYKPVIVDELSIDNTELYIYDGTKDSTKLYVKNMTLEIHDIHIDSFTLRNRMPVDFGKYSTHADSIFVKTSAYENLTVKNFHIKNKKAMLNGIHLYTKYSRNELSRIIPKERDHYDVYFDKFEIKDIDFGFNNRKFFAKSPFLQITNPAAIIYRDKLVRDDLTIKPLYSKMLRDLPINLTIDSLDIKNGTVKYTERVKADNTGGTVLFSNLDAKISNVSNTYVAPTQTEANIEATFMDYTPVSVNWAFNVNNTADKFLLQADIGGMKAEQMNRFTKPNLNVMMEGETKKTFFTIDGTDYSSHINMKINYDDFNVVILRKDGDKKNKFLSAVANIFISKDSEKKGEKYREGEGDVQRNQNQSIFNYFWINVKEGLMKSLFGKQKKN